MQCSEVSLILKSSKLGGIGVFATHDIPAGVSIFNNPFEVRILNKREVPKEFLDYCIQASDEELICPMRFDRIDVGWYINHSAEPNVFKKSISDNSKLTSAVDIINDIKSSSLIAGKEIKAGEEILMDYNNLNEPEHLKEEYYK